MVGKTLPTFFFLLVKNEATEFVGNSIEYPPHSGEMSDAIFLLENGEKEGSPAI